MRQLNAAIEVEVGVLEQAPDSSLTSGASCAYEFEKKTRV
jgi:hypothetical protein